MPELRKDPITDQLGHHLHGPGAAAVGFRPRTNSLTAFRAVLPSVHGNESKTPPEVLAYRNGSEANQPGWSLRVVPNKFPVLGIEGDLMREGEGLFDKMQGIGAHEVIVEAPEHALSITDLSGEID